MSNLCVPANYKLFIDVFMSVSFHLKDDEFIHYCILLINLNIVNVFMYMYIDLEIELLLL